MPYYKDINNNVHFLDDRLFEHLLPVGSIEITDDEMLVLTAIPETIPEEISPLEKLRQFLACNSDVAALL